MTLQHQALLGLLPQAGQPRIEVAVPAALVIDADFSVKMERGGVATYVIVNHELWAAYKDRALIVSMWAQALPIYPYLNTHIAVTFGRAPNRLCAWRTSVPPATDLTPVIEDAIQRAFAAWEVVRCIP